MIRSKVTVRHGAIHGARRKSPRGFQARLLRRLQRYAPITLMLLGLASIWFLFPPQQANYEAHVLPKQTPRQQSEELVAGAKTSSPPVVPTLKKFQVTAEKDLAFAPDAALTSTAIARLKDEAADELDLRDKLKQRRERVDRRNKERKEMYHGARQKRDASMPITVMLRDGDWPWAHLDLFSEKYVHDCPVPCRATQNSSYLDVANVVLRRDPHVDEKALRPDQLNGVLMMEFWLKTNNRSHTPFIDFLASYSPTSDVMLSYAYGAFHEDTNQENIMEKFIEKGVLAPSPAPTLQGAGDVPKNKAKAWAVPDFDTKAKDHDVVLFVSNCGSVWRQPYLGALISHLQSRRVTVHSYGGCYRTPGLQGAGTDKMETVNKYKVFLSFENTLTDGYLTEKFFQASWSDAVPGMLVKIHELVNEPHAMFNTLVYFGGGPKPDVASVFFPQPKNAPPAFVNGWDYPDPADLAKEIEAIVRDKATFDAYFEWRRFPRTSDLSSSVATVNDRLGKEFINLFNYNFVNTGKYSWICRTCQYYHEHYDYVGFSSTKS